ncbi:MAG: alpha/beta hydrolase [Acidobacteriia bacterium]|nr:alpha/beta hydrolase [Terriglobia bacterium]
MNGTAIGQVMVLSVVLSAGLAAQTQEGARRAAFLKMIDRPRVALAPQVSGDRFSYAADAEQRVPGLWVRPQGAGKHPVVIVLHGTGGTKEGQLPVLKQLAAKGFLAVAIDGRYHGERIAEKTGSAAYQAAMLKTYQTGREHPFLYDTVWDVMRLMDYLETLPEVDATRIGMIGFSKGGMETYLAAAVDSRVKVAVPCIGVQSFAWALDHDSWQSRAGTFQSSLDTAAKETGAAGVDAKFVKHFYDKVAPGIYGEFDGPAMVPLIAPRALMTINGEIDARTPMPGLELCLAAARKAYARAADKFEVVIEKNTGHAVKPEALVQAVDWFVKWL